MKKICLFVMVFSVASFAFVNISFAEEMESQTHEFIDELDGSVSVTFPERITKQEFSTCLGNFSIYTSIIHDVEGNAWIDFQKIESPGGALSQWFDGTNKLVVDMLSIDGQVFLVSGGGVYPFDPIQEKFTAAVFYQPGNYFMSSLFCVIQEDDLLEDVYLPYYDETGFIFLGLVHYQDGIWQLVDHVGLAVHSWVYMEENGEQCGFPLMSYLYGNQEKGLLVYNPFLNEFKDLEVKF